MTSKVQSRPFGDLAEFRNGVNFSADARRGGDLAVIGVGDFETNERLTEFTHLERIARPKGLDDDALLQDGDLVFVRSNGNKKLIGRCMILHSVQGQVSHSGFTIRARVTSNEVAPEWIAQYFASGLAKRDIMRRGGGTNISNLSQQILQDLPIPVPSRRIQGQVLKTAHRFSATVQTIDSLLKARRSLKFGLMQQLLTGQRRFPDCHHTPWRHARMGDHVREVTRKNLIEGTVVLTASGEFGLVDQRQYFNRNVAGANLSRYSLLKKGEFAYNRSAMHGFPYGATKRLDDHDEGALSTLYLCFAITDTNLDSDYLKYVFDSGVLNRQLRPIVRIGARAHGLLNVTSEDFLSISIPFPNVQEQQRIAAVLRALDRQTELLGALRQKIEALKREVLARLLSGELAPPTAA